MNLKDLDDMMSPLERDALVALPEIAKALERIAKALEKQPPGFIEHVAGMKEDLIKDWPKPDEGSLYQPGEKDRGPHD